MAPDPAPTARARAGRAPEDATPDPDTARRQNRTGRARAGTPRVLGHDPWPHSPPPGRPHISCRTTSPFTRDLAFGEGPHQRRPGPVHAALQRADLHAQDDRGLLVAEPEDLDHDECLPEIMGQSPDGGRDPQPVLD